MSSNFNLKQPKKIEWLVLAAIIIIIVVLFTIWFFNFQMGLRDSKRKADINSIASSIEVHYNTTNNQYCNNGPIGSYCHPQFTWFEGGVPHDPLTGDYINLPSDGDKQYLICAKLERGGGNSASSDGTPASGSSAKYYCEHNQQ